MSLGSEVGETSQEVQEQKYLEEGETFRESKEVIEETKELDRLTSEPGESLEAKGDFEESETLERSFTETIDATTATLEVDTTGMESEDTSEVSRQTLIGPEDQSSFEITEDPSLESKSAGFNASGDRADLSVEEPVAEAEVMLGEVREFSDESEPDREVIIPIQDEGGIDLDTDTVDTTGDIREPLYADEPLLDTDFGDDSIFEDTGFLGEHGEPEGPQGDGFAVEIEEMAEKTLTQRDGVGGSEGEHIEINPDEDTGEEVLPTLDQRLDALDPTGGVPEVGGPDPDVLAGSEGLSPWDERPDLESAAAPGADPLISEDGDGDTQGGDTPGGGTESSGTQGGDTQGSTTQSGDTQSSTTQGDGTQGGSTQGSQSSGEVKINTSMTDTSDSSGQQRISSSESYETDDYKLEVETTHENGETTQKVKYTDKKTGRTETEKSKMYDPDAVDESTDFTEGGLFSEPIVTDPMDIPEHPGATMTQPAGDDWDERGDEPPPMTMEEAMAGNVDPYAHWDGETSDGISSGTKIKTDKPGDDLIDDEGMVDEVGTGGGLHEPD